MLTNINIDQLLPHPNNPRRDLGDLSELADSIRQAGVLQNLTVVPEDDRYTVIIGHRRLAAAKLAGLTELPCTITEMDDKTQLATMLLENMQRSDLTPVEQAQGFQLMLDLGEDVESIAEQTGFSESTVRRRVKLLDLDQEALREAEQRGGTLQDYMELDKIKDPNRKNAVLGTIGTDNFKYELRRAVSTEETEALKESITTALEAFATRVDTGDGYTVVRTIIPYSTLNAKEYAPPEDAAEVDYFFRLTDWGQFHLLKKRPGQEAIDAQAQARQQEQEAHDQRRAQLEEVSRQAYELRKAFVREYPGHKKDGRYLMAVVAQVMIGVDWLRSDDDLFMELMDIEVVQGDDEEDDVYDARLGTAIANKCEVHAEKALSAAAYCCGLDKDHWHYFNWKLEYAANPQLDKIYGILCKLGYRMSDEEKALQDGSHELYLKDVAE